MRAVRILPGRKLTPHHQSEWARLQASNPHLDSAFYAPDLTQLVAAVRDDVKVAVITEGNQTVGFSRFWARRVAPPAPWLDG